MAYSASCSEGQFIQDTANSLATINHDGGINTPITTDVHAYFLDTFSQADGQNGIDLCTSERVYSINPDTLITDNVYTSIEIDATTGVITTVLHEDQTTGTYSI